MGTPRIQLQENLPTNRQIETNERCIISVTLFFFLLLLAVCLIELIIQCLNDIFVKAAKSHIFALGQHVCTTLGVNHLTFEGGVVWARDHSLLV